MAISDIHHHQPAPASPPAPQLEVVADVAPPAADVAGRSGLLDLDPLLLRSMGQGIVGAVALAMLSIVVPLTITRGLAYGLGVGGFVAFWCGIGFGMIAGSAIYVARSERSDT